MSLSNVAQPKRNEGEEEEDDDDDDDGGKGMGEVVVAGGFSA